AGFLIPFAAAGLTGTLSLAGGNDFYDLKYSLFYLVLVPLILLTGLAASIKSMPRIKDQGDKDYAYSGLTLNIVFLAVYVLSVLVFLFA
ncbi:MAG: hypothetical protein JRF65_13170, partial [Deltaproteobacteria bacterium]|nr:hypothetical protein [Deltaproteobacteria bacterium]